MFRIQGLDHIVLLTTKMPAMRKFYLDVLGCELEREQPQINLVQLRAGKNIIDLVAVKEKPPGQNVEHFCLQIHPFNFPELEQYFAKHEIAIERYGERYGAQGLGWSFYLNDPEGNQIELTEKKN